MRDRGSVRYVVGSHSSGSSSGDSDGDCPAPGLQDHTFEGESRMVADHTTVEAAAATAMETVRPLGFKITSRCGSRLSSSGDGDVGCPALGLKESESEKETHREFEIQTHTKRKARGENLTLDQEATPPTHIQKRIQMRSMS